MRDTIRSLAEGNKIVFLLSSIFLLAIGYPLAEMGVIAALLYLGIYIVVVCSFIYLVSGSRVLLVINILLAFIITLLAFINIINDPAPLVLAVAWNITGLLQQFLIIALLVAFIIESKVVTRQVLYAGVAIYFSMSTFFATLYNLIELMSPGAFLASTGAAITPTNLTYFSLVTLSTLGYGDIIPVAPVAQSLAVLQASVGTLYIAILIGRFVSLYQHDAA